MAKLSELTIDLSIGNIEETVSELKRVQREAKKATQAIRELEALEVPIKTQRPCGWEIIQASKTEGASDKDIETFAVANVRDIKAKIEELRKEGYRFFFIFKSVGVVDDILIANNGSESND